MYTVYLSIIVVIVFAEATVQARFLATVMVAFCFFFVCFFFTLGAIIIRCFLAHLTPNSAVSSELGHIILMLICHQPASFRRHLMCPVSFSSPGSADSLSTRHTLDNSDGCGQHQPRRGTGHRSFSEGLEGISGPDVPHPYGLHGIP